MNQAKYSTHIIEMFRNNGIVFGRDGEETNLEKADKNSIQCDSKFFMFDYFDVLLYKNLESSTKQYLNYFTIKDIFHNAFDYKVSYKSLSLYHDAGDCQNPFIIEKGNTLSDTPFLGVIQICLCKECYEGELSGTVDEFLHGYEEKIEAILEADKEVRCQNNVIISSKQLYRSSTTGDFCLALRTNSIEEIYKIALQLNDSQYMITYTNVGIECMVDQEGNYCTLSESFVTMHQNLCFALRFSADCSLKEKLIHYEKMRNPGCRQQKFEVTKGLFGRYDYLLNIDIEEFAEIFPILCEKKFGETGKSRISEGGNGLTDIIQHPYIRNINERVLVDLQDLGNVYNQSFLNGDSFKYKVNKDNEKLYQKIRAIAKYRKYFTEEYRAFEDLYRGLEEIYKTFSALGMERDAYINWLIFHKDINVLCDSIQQWRKEYTMIDEKEQDLCKTARVNCLKNWRTTLNAVNQYTRFLHNVNYQTYQSPIYELQTKIDTEKAMVAYREAMECYLQTANEALGNNDIVYPIIYSDLSVDKVVADATFRKYCNADGKREREIVCTVPSFEYFGRLYDLLPWIMHESSHQIRNLSRYERNQFITHYIFSLVMENFMLFIIRNNSGNPLYQTPGKVENVLTEAMITVAENDIKNMGEGKIIKNSDYESMVDIISEYLNRLFYNSWQEVGQDNCANPKEMTDRIRQELLDLFRRDNLLSSDILERIDIIFKNGRADGEFERLIKKLLNHYKRSMEEISSQAAGSCLGTELIGLKDIRKTSMEFDRRLLVIVDSVGEADFVMLQDALREYCYIMKKIFRIYELYGKISETDTEVLKFRKEFLGKVYNQYQESEDISLKHRKMLMDPEIEHLLRNFGLIDCEQSVFEDKLLEMLQKMDVEKIQSWKKRISVIYRETFADLMMVKSLEMNSFAYCRQAFQTVSDAQIELEKYAYQSVNFERMRLVMAVLLWAENQQQENIDGEKEICIHGDSVMEEGKVYCEYTLRCVQEKMLQELDKRTKDKEKKDKEKKDERDKELIYDLIGLLNEEMKYLLDCGGKNAYFSSSLYFILHGEGKYTDYRTSLKWQDYKSIHALIKPYKYILRRIESFYLGLQCIFKEKKVYVSFEVFQHMCTLYEKAKSEKKGCRWEAGLPEWLLEPKWKVGEFYNKPKLVYELKAEDKLENTIDFIQNFYYYNRFRVIQQYQAADDTGDEK